VTGQLLASRVRKARRPGTCPLCQEPIFIGQLIGRTVAWSHVLCVLRERQATYTAPLTTSTEGDGHDLAR
jgi:hypothetical protein